ncbi:MAG: SprT family zinc-dependent metalloprotease [Vibrionaceae bacterium]
MSSLSLQQDLQQQMRAQVAAAIEQANRHYQLSLTVPSVRFNLRGTTAGIAKAHLWQLCFNPILLEKNAQAFLHEVVAHEVSHLLVYALFGQSHAQKRLKPHGKEWQTIMRELFALRPRATHSFDVSFIAGVSRRFVYRCACDDFLLTAYRHNRIQKQKTQYLCKKCHEVLNFVQNA